MPNYCGNELKVFGSYDERNKFVQLMNENDDNKDSVSLSFNYILPCQDDDYGVIWCSQNWGTKWGAFDVELTHNENETTYIFRTAWKPPSEKFLNLMAEKFPDVYFELKYGETGCRFYGEWNSKSKISHYKELYDKDYIYCEEEENYIINEKSENHEILKSYEHIFKISC
jgi:hypothetical protein